MAGKPSLEVISGRDSLSLAPRKVGCGFWSRNCVSVGPCEAGKCEREANEVLGI